MPPGFNRRQLTHQVRRALVDLHDPVALRGNPLGDALVSGANPADRALALQAHLMRLVESLKPAPATQANAKAWRAYRVLQLRYVESRTAVEVGQVLALGASQYYREHQAALEALTTLIFDSISTAVATTADSSCVDPAVMDRRHNLPTRVNSFIGREREIADIHALLQRTRLLTLTGTGGCGKTRLALEAAATEVVAYAGGIWVTDLTPLSEPGLVAQSVAVTLGMREAPGEPVLVGLIRGIGSRALLLVLDNCEHLLQACAQLIDRVLRDCPNVRVLVTSRERVGIDGEMIYLVPPLRLPEPSQPPAATDELMRSAAVQLFVDRAAEVAPGFTLTPGIAEPVVQICHRLDGLPLAIELAAARVNALSPHQLAQRLDSRFRLLTSGNRIAPAHHQTLRALVDWSYESLTEQERVLFRRLSVFAGGWTVEAAEVVCGGDGLEVSAIIDVLGGLVQRSLVVAEPVAAAMRYRMLETLRAYAVEQLDQAEDPHARRERHARYFVGLARDLELMAYGPLQLSALEQLELEHSNLRAVLSNAWTSGTAAALAARVAASLGLFWFTGNYFSEARHWLDFVLSVDGVVDAPSGVCCLAIDGFLAVSMGHHESGMKMCDRAVSAAERGDDAWMLAVAYVYRCGADFVTGDPRATERDARIGVRACGDADWPLGAALCSAWLGRSLLMQSKPDEAVVELRGALERGRAVGDPFSTALALSFYGLAIGAEGDYMTAASCLGDALNLFRQLGSYAQMSRCLVDLAVLALRADRIDDAAAALLEGVTMTRQLGSAPYRLAQILSVTAQVAVATRQWLDAAHCLKSAQDVRRRSGTHLAPEAETAEVAMWRAVAHHLDASELAAFMETAPIDADDAALVLAQQILETARHEVHAAAPLDA
jgi:non-specific serine/threonine protein kinase